MIRYLKIYKALLKANLIALTTYRGNFVNSTISSFMWGLFSIATVLLLTSRITSVFGWKREDLILLTAVYSLIVGIFHIFFSRNFERFARVIAWGSFDSVLLKPIDSQFSISFWEVNYPALSRIVLGVLLLVYMLFSFSYSINFLSAMFFVIMLITGVLCLYSLWLFAATLLIWVPQLTNIIEFMYTVNGFTRNPPEIYKKVSGILFLFLLPVVFVATSPLKFLIGTADFFDVFILLLITGVLLITSRMFWMFGLRFYTSASSN